MEKNNIDFRKIEENIEEFVVFETERYRNCLKRMEKDCGQKVRKKQKEFLGQVFETEERIYTDAESITVEVYLSHEICYDITLLKQFEMAINEKDWGKVNRCLYQKVRNDVFPRIDICEEDHCYHFQKIMVSFACGDFSVVESLFPKELGESKNGYIFRKAGTNLVMGMYYQDTHLEEIGLIQAEKYVKGKDTGWMRASIGFLAAVVKKDFQQASEQLFALCKNYKRAKSVMIEEEYKPFCTYAHGLYRFAGEYLKEEEFAQIKMPEIDNFSKEYIQYCYQHREEKPKPLIIFPEEMELVNKAFLIPLTKTELVYIDGRYPKWCVDCRKMVDNFILELKNCKIDL